jgi:hypothetical protein
MESDMNRSFRPVLTLLVMMLTLVAVASASHANIPPGSNLQVRVSEKLSSETANVGDHFHGALTAPVVANGRTLFPRGAEVTGEVVNVERSGRLSSPGELHLALKTIRSSGRTYALDVAPIVIKGDSHTKSNVTKIGGGAAAGAIIGAIVGGGKGAAIGTGVGAAAGTATAAATGKKAAEVQSEDVLTWVAQSTSANTTFQGQNSRRPEEDSHADEDANRRTDRYVRDGNEDYDGSAPTGFSDRERRIISSCFSDDRAGLPPGLAKKDHLPPGLEKQLQRNGTLPPGLQKRVQPLPGECTARLPQLPRDWARVVLSGRIILLDPRQRIVDLLYLGRD